MVGFWSTDCTHGVTKSPIHSCRYQAILRGVNICEFFVVNSRKGRGLVSIDHCQGTFLSHVYYCTFTVTRNASGTNNHSNSDFDQLEKKQLRRTWKWSLTFSMPVLRDSLNYFLQSLWVSYLTCNYVSSQGTIYVVSFPQKRCVIILTTSRCRAKK